MGGTIAPDKILKELSDLWVDTAKQGEGDGSAGVLRACSMTLLVLAEASDDMQALGETLAALMPEHPARTIVVKVSGAGERSLTERVYSQCWMPFGQRRQICCEQVEITVSDAALGDLESVVLPLMVPDLPLIVWCRSNRVLQMDQFRQIARMADKVVFDSAAATQPMQVLLRAENLAASGVMLGDLSWTVMTRWREMLSQVFENHQNAVQVSRIETVYVEWGGSRQVPALYLGVWIRDSMAAAGVTSTLSMAKVSQSDYFEVRMVADGFDVELAREDDRMVVTLNGVSQCTNLPQPSDYLLMREELGIVRRDAVFEKALASAAQFAHPTKK